MRLGKPKMPDWHTGVVERSNDDTATAVPYWEVYYKGVKFAEFDTLNKASTRLQKLMDLDTSKEDSRFRKRFAIREETPPDE